MNPAAPVTRMRTRAGSPRRGRPRRRRRPCRRRAGRGMPCAGAPRTRMSLSLEHASSVHEPVVLDVRVGRRAPRAPGPGEQLAQLVGERRPRVVRLGLERHAEDADGLALQPAVAPFERGHDVGRQALVDLHRGLADREVVAGEGGELHRVLEQARAGGEARARAGPPRAGSPRGSRAGRWCNRPRPGPAIMKNWFATANFM